MTQCPIVPGDYYQYDFKVSDQVRVITGTNFLLITASARLEHSGTTHIIVRQLTVNIQASANLRKTATQYCDGLRGALVVYDPLDPNRLL